MCNAQVLMELTAETSAKKDVGELGTDLFSRSDVFVSIAGVFRM